MAITVTKKLVTLEISGEDIDALMQLCSLALEVEKINTPERNTITFAEFLKKSKFDEDSVRELVGFAEEIFESIGRPDETA